MVRPAVVVSWVLGVVVVAAVAVVVVHSSNRVELPKAAPAMQPAEARSAAPLPVPVEVKTSGEAERTGEVIEPEAAPVEVEPKTEKRDDEIAGPKDGVLVEGSVVVVDENGVERTNGDGTFRATYWKGSSGGGNDSIRIGDGRFRLRLPKGADLGVERLEIDGGFVSTDPDRLTIEPGKPLVVHGRAARTVLLHVVDAESYAELSDVTVLWNETWLVRDEIHPGELGADHTLVTRAASPIEATVRDDEFSLRWEEKLFAVAPGHAWGALKVDYRRGGELTLELPRGGDLEVTVVGSAPQVATSRLGSFSSDDSQGIIRIRRASDAKLPDLETEVADAVERMAKISDDELRKWSPDARRPTEAEIRRNVGRSRQYRADAAASGVLVTAVAPVPDGPTRIAGLAPGPVIVALERGSRRSDPLVLGETTVEIIEGGTAHASITIDAHPESRKRVRFAGTVHCANAWKSKRLDLHFEPADVPGSTSTDSFAVAEHEFTNVAGTAGLYRFDAGQVLPGRYVVKVHSLEFQQVVETGPEGTDEAAIVIGDPADIHVRFVDADSGQPFEPPPMLLWSCVRPEESRGGGFEAGTWDESLRAVRLRAPAGPIQLSIDFAHADEFKVLDSLFITAMAGPNDVTLRLRRAIAITLGVTIEGKEADWPGWPELSRIWKTQLTAADDESRTVTPSRVTQVILYFSVTAEGRYTVDFPTLDGFAAVPPFEVVARRGEKTVATVELHRVR